MRTEEDEQRSRQLAADTSAFLIRQGYATPEDVIFALSTLLQVRISKLSKEDRESWHFKFTESMTYAFRREEPANEN
jgi:hypothetical protein